MSRWLALLSGKGGSGKTTLALSIASMLSDCGVKVLLIDCDLSTNGATYFYEDKLTEYDGNIKSFYNLISIPMHDIKENLIKINDNMDFMPSIIQITKKNTESYAYKECDIDILPAFRKVYDQKYDVILLDCQAGYTDILKLILPIVDVNLFVMEADAISSSSIRSLYLKIGDFLNEKKVYQVFNKATDEEYQVYSKLSGGTVFTNIETVMFDWKIRKAFSIAEIPDMKNTSASYGMQIYNICNILFKDKSIQDKLSKYKTIIQINKIKEEENIIEQKIDKLRERKTWMRDRLFRIMIVSVFLICFPALILNLINQKVLSNYSGRSFILLGMIMILIMSIALFALMLIENIKENNSYYKEKEIYRRQLETILKDKQKLQKQYNSYHKNGESVVSETIDVFKK